MKGKKRLSVVLALSLMAGSMGTGAFAADTTAQNFADLTNHWSKTDVEYLIGKGIVDGLEQDGKKVILPDKTVTRAEYVKILLGAMNKKPAASAASTFKDVPADHWANAYIEAAKEAGLTDGYEDGTFRPEKEITRAELTTLLVRGFKLTAGSGAAVEFADVDASDWAYSYIRTASSLKLVEGVTENGKTLFKPAKAATRAESMTVIARYLRTEEGKAPGKPAAEDTKKPGDAVSQTPTGSGSGSGGSGSSDSSSDDDTGIKVQLGGDDLAAAINNGNPINGADALGNTATVTGLAIDGFTGDVKDISVTPVSPETVFAANDAVVPGITGPVIEFDTKGKTFNSATLTVDVSKIASRQNLVVAYYNETSRKFEFLPTTYDNQNGSLSFTTTHNSKYVLIDKLAWEQTWRNNLAVGNGSSKSYVDFAFVIDSSGSMSWNDPNDLRKKAVTDLVYNLHFDAASSKITENVNVADVVYSRYSTEYKRVNGSVTYTVYTNTVASASDRAAIVDFDSTAVLGSSFSADGATVAKAVYNIDSNGGTNIFAGLKTAFDLYEKSGDPNHRWVIVLLTDGQDANKKAADWNSIQSAYSKGISVVTMGLSDDVDQPYLQQIAALGGGQYFHVKTADQLQSYFKTVVETTQHKEFIDVDQDGLDDYYEVTGMLLDNGMIVKTSIDTGKGKDTDGDGFTDGEEMGQPTDVVITADMVPQGSDLVGKTVKVFQNYKTNPNNPAQHP